MEEITETATLAADAALHCAAVKPTNPIVDVVASYVPNIALGIGIIIAIILFFSALGVWWEGKDNSAAAWLFVSAIGVAFIGYGVGYVLAGVPFIGPKFQCRVKTGKAAAVGIGWFGKQLDYASQNWWSPFWIFPHLAKIQWQILTLPWNALTLAPPGYEV